MNRQKNQNEVNSGLLRDIQDEISVESAPLLRFIARYASAIASIVLAFLLLLGGMGIWRWYHGGKQIEAREELARINMELKGGDRNAALNRLAENAPDGVKLFVYMSLAQSAQENGDPVLAADAYAKAAKLDGDGSLGLAAALSGAGSLLAQGEYAQALALLLELETRLPATGQSRQFRQTIAEAAEKAGKIDLAVKTYQALASDKDSAQADYFKSRADALSERAKGKTSQ